MPSPTFTLDELTTPLTRQEIQKSIYDVLGLLGVNTTGWKSGAVVRTMIVASSVVLAAFSELQSAIARGGFLALAEGQWLTLVARYVFGVERIGATFASGTITLINSGGGVYSFDPDDLIFGNEITGKTYRNVGSVSLGASSTITIPIQATEAGSPSTSGPEEIRVMVTTVLGVTCNNLSQLTGTDDEKDAALRSRCQERLGALSPFGPWDAYAHAVRSATRADETSVGVTRLRIVKDGFGNVTTYLAGVDGAIAGDPEDPDTDLGIANEAIQRNAAPLAINAIVLSADNHPIAVTYEVWMYSVSSLTDDNVAGLIIGALAAFMQAQPIGGNAIGSDPGKVFVHAIRTAIFNAVPEIFQVAITVPAVDEVMDPQDVATLGVITPTAIHRVAPPEGFGGTL